MKLKSMMIKQEKHLMVFFMDLSELYESLDLILGFGHIQFGVHGIESVPEDCFYLFGCLLSLQ